DDLSEATLLDISHESLIRQWRRLQEWTKEEAQSAEMYRRLTDTAERYQQGKAELLRGVELATALDWRKKNQPTAAWVWRYGGEFQAAMDFLQQSRLEEEAEKESEKKRRRSTIGMLIIGLVLVSGLAGFGMWQWQKARINLRRVEEQNEITVRWIRNLGTVIASPNDQQIKSVIEDISNEINKLSNYKDKDSQREKSIYLILNSDLLSMICKKKTSYYQCKNLLQFYNDSLEITEELAGKNPDDSRLKIDLSIIYRKIGDAQAKQNNNKDAVEEYNKSFNTLTLDFNNEFIDDLYLQALWDLSLSYRRLGEKQLSLGRAEETLRQYQKELKLLEFFASHTSTSKASTIQAELNLARSNKRLGETEEELGSNETALNYYKNALKQYENAWKIYSQSLTDDIPINKETKEEIAGGLANIYDDLGRTTMKAAGYTQEKLLEAENFFAESLKRAPKVKRFLDHDMELAWLQDDAARCRQRIATLGSLLRPVDTLYSIVRFYEWLLKPEASWQPLLSAIESSGEAVRPDWDFSTSLPKIQQVPDRPRQAAETFIAYFERDINLSELRQKLDSLQSTTQLQEGKQ
ncbi:MAG: hypothetical protein D3906_03010, partial [Candidatus Electrothrix sp. AUS1_2]|nr:hypothetical protein [Candidatus Electrothrix sp. AUS1_2]